MKKIIPILLILLLLTGCSAPAEGTGRTYIDDLGRKVSIDEAPERVASLLGSFSDVWVLAGGDLVASADDAWDDFGLELDAVDLGGTKEPNLEKLLESGPDLVLASTNTEADLAMLETLEAAGIPALYFDVSDFDDYLRMLEICTDILGRPDLYQAHGLAIRDRIDASVARVREHFGSEPPKVLFLRASAASIRAKNSEGSILGEMLADFGCVNIADTDGSLLETLSMEHILAQDPDYIFFVQVGDDAEGMQANIDAFFAENPAWQTLTAVQEGRVYYLDKRLYNLKPNARWAESYEGLEAIFIE